MLDRASTFAQPEIVELLKTRFVPVAIDQAYQRRQRDAEGEFYRKIASQGPRNDFRQTTQGFYIATPDGQLLLYNNNRNPEKLLRLMSQKLRDYKPVPAKALADPPPNKRDRRYNVRPPEGGLVVRVNAKVLGGYERAEDRRQKIFQNALSRDNLWISAAEHRALVGGELPRALQQRIARFHLVDNTRGEPPMWKNDEIRELHLTLQDGALSGHVRLETKGALRGFDAQLQGRIEVESGRVVRLEIVCLGEFWGEGRYTRGAPQGRFPLGVAFTLADGTDPADTIPPQGSRGWVAGYLR